MATGLNIPAHDNLAVAVVSAIHKGDVDELRRLLNENPGLAMGRVVDAQGGSQTLLHIVADWPSHFPNGAETVAGLVAAGAEADEITNACWSACRGGQQQTAEYLLGRDADLNCIGWDQRTPLDV